MQEKEECVMKYFSKSWFSVAYMSQERVVWHIEAVRDKMAAIAEKIHFQAHYLERKC